MQITLKQIISQQWQAPDDYQVLPQFCSKPATKKLTWFYIFLRAELEKNILHHAVLYSKPCPRRKTDKQFFCTRV